MLPTRDGVIHISDLMKTVEVRSPSAVAETGSVLRAAFHILFWSALVIGLERGEAPSAGDTSTIRESAPGTVAFRDLSSSDQRMFRQIEEGLAEAEVARGKTGAWPSPLDLADQGIPPFTSDPLDKERYVWTFLRRAEVVNYVGAPSAKASGFLVMLVEPDKSAPIDPRAQTDEFHHRLSDGTLVHVSIWQGDKMSEVTEPLAAAPTNRSWRQVVVDLSARSGPR